MSRATALSASPTAPFGRIAGLSDMREVCSAWNTGVSLATSAGRNKPIRGLPMAGRACYITPARGIAPALSLHPGRWPPTAGALDRDPGRFLAPKRREARRAKRDERPNDA